MYYLFNDKSKPPRLKNGVQMVWKSTV